ncbi:hypothetical protein NLJ89_g6382 [Agrocybe chaxingu]|uniref:C2H2-type domain-containing protein n=1 Tax=Agrocybe chaxingu TaxID=84603 RepID=A0A9W8MW29_9AGAR|nr:hypothetical protein NLJ89_g6382 [Agrocybe chaxingu]
MQHREPRPYAYDDQNTAYPPAHQSEYTSTGYQYDSTGHYYAAPTHGSVGGGNDMANPASPYFRSMTPSLVSSNRYPSGHRDPRYYNSHGLVASSSSLAQSVYTAHAQQYPSQYLPTSDQRSLPLNANPHHPQFIPTPSEIASTYSANYTHPLTTPHSPTIPEDPYSTSSLDYPRPPHMVPSSHGSHGHRPSRIVTGRPRTGSATASTSPTSASSPSGERFPCEKCGKTFSRSHDRKRHHETQHLASPVIHRCVYCQKEFSRCGPPASFLPRFLIKLFTYFPRLSRRADSLKRHLDNGCDEMHS